MPEARGGRNIRFIGRREGKQQASDRCAARIHDAIYRSPTALAADFNQLCVLHGNGYPAEAAGGALF
jgi:hypothetical protein